MKNTLFSQPQQKLVANGWDLLALLLVFTIVIAITWAGSHMALPFHLGQTIPISLSPWALPQYALQTTIRMFIALIASFIFSMVVATIAAKSERAAKLIIPLIDILQSVPILGYLSIAVVAFIAVFPGSMLGPECAAIFAVFTSQVWNMTLSFYQSLKTIPGDLIEASYMMQLSPWQRFWRLEAPFAMPGLLWNAMMSMSGSWFFIVAAEAISVANQNITLPGVGSYIALAITHKDMHAIGYAIITMLAVILLYDQLFFRPLVAWSEKFHLTDIPDNVTQSWVLNLFQRTRLLRHWGQWLARINNAIVNFPLFQRPFKRPKSHIMAEKTSHWLFSALWYCLIGGMFCVTLLLLWRFVYQHIPFVTTWHVIVLGFYTGVRVFVSILACSIVWVPIGIWIGLRPKVAQVAQPIAQILAAFPANLCFPVIVLMILHFHLNVEIWCAPLMILGTQWYILFNVIAGAGSIPKELKLAAKNMQLKGWLKWKRFLFPAIFPFYVTGAITAAGGAWNASIVAEVMEWGHTQLVAHGLGAYITLNTTAGHFSRVALGIVIMCLWVTCINFFVWRKLYQYAEQRFRLG